MTARDRIGGALYGNVRPDYEFDVADLVIAAIRAMPLAEIAELTGGTVQIAPCGNHVQVIGPWEKR